MKTMYRGCCMKKKIILSCLVLILLAMLPVYAEAQEVVDYEITLPLSFGSRRGNFTGYLKNGMPYGFGIFEYVSPGRVEWRYEGEFAGGQFNGAGDFVSARGHRQEGTFYNSRLHGEGRLYGEGGQLQATGTFAEGELQDGVATEYEITLPLSFGNRTGYFTGSLQNGLPYGHGIFEYLSPARITWRYEGEFAYGQFNGEGEFAGGNGERRVGIFYNSQLHGEGRIYQDGRLTAHGTFVDGELREGTRYDHVQTVAVPVNESRNEPAGTNIDSFATAGVAISLAVTIGLFVLFFVAPVVAVVVIIYKILAKSKAQTQLEILKKQAELRQFQAPVPQSVSWQCPSCTGSNENREICEYCGSARPRG